MVVPPEFKPSEADKLINSEVDIAARILCTKLGEKNFKLIKKLIEPYWQVKSKEKVEN